MSTIPAGPEWQTVPQPDRPTWQIDAQDIDRGLRWQDEAQDEARAERGMS